MQLKTRKKFTKVLVVERNRQTNNQWTERMASSLIGNDDNDDDNGRTCTTHQQQQQQHQYNANIVSNNNYNTITNNNYESVGNIMQRRQALEQRKQNLDKLLNEKSWLLQQIQKQEIEILNGNFEYLNLNDFVQSLSTQYKQELSKQTMISIDAAQDAQPQHKDNVQLRYKSLLTSTAKDEDSENGNDNPYNKSNCTSSNSSKRYIIENQSEISNRSSEYDNFPNVEINQSSGSAVHYPSAPYPLKASVKKRVASIVGSRETISTSAVMQGKLHEFKAENPQEHNNEQSQQLTTKNQHQVTNYSFQHQQQQKQQQEAARFYMQQQQQHHQVLLPHIQCATQKFYYTTLYAQAQPQAEVQTQGQSQLSCYVQPLPQTYMTAPSTSLVDNISLYSVNSTSISTKHNQHAQPQYCHNSYHQLSQQPQLKQQQQPLIVQYDKYYLSPTYQPISQSDGGGFIKSSQNIKEYISPFNSPQSTANNNNNNSAGSNTTCGGLRDSQIISRIIPVKNQLTQRITPTAAMDIISLVPSYLQMEEATIDFTTATTSTSGIPRTATTATVTMPPNMQSYSQHNSIANNNNQSFATALPIKYNNKSSISQDIKLHFRNNNNDNNNNSSGSCSTAITTSYNIKKSNKSNSKHYYDAAFQASPSRFPSSTETYDTVSRHGENNFSNNNTSNNNNNNNNNSGNFGILSKSLSDTTSITTITSTESTDKLRKQQKERPQQQQSKTKQWMESSLDGPVIRHNHTNNSSNINERNNISPGHLIQRKKLSSQSMHTITTRPYTTSNAMSTGMENYHHYHNNHYPRSSTINALVAAGDNSFITTPMNMKLLTHNDRDNYYHHNHHYNKLSQSTSYLNQMSMAIATTAAPSPTSSATEGGRRKVGEEGGEKVGGHLINLVPQNFHPYKCLPSRQVMMTMHTPISDNTQLQATMAITTAAATNALYVNTNISTTISNYNYVNDGGSMIATTTTTTLSPEIRIESPKNITIVQPATFQPYKEITKPFEMSDFYKYSTKFRQRESRHHHNNSEDIN